MGNQIYQLNEAEGIFYPAFDKYLCRDAQIVKGCVGRIEHNMMLDKEGAEALKALVAGDEKLQHFYRSNAEEAMKIIAAAVICILRIFTCRRQERLHCPSILTMTGFHEVFTRVLPCRYRRISFLKI